MIHKNVLIITSWSFNDALIQTYTLPYVEMISKQLSKDSKIFLVTLDREKSKNLVLNPKINLISFDYYPLGFKGIVMWLKLLFGLKRLIYKEKISFVNAWCTPAGMIAYLLTIFTNKKLIIDSYEPHAQSMIENGTWNKKGLAARILTFFEGSLAKKADFLIATTERFKYEMSNKLNLDVNKIFVKPACVDLDLFSYKNVKNEYLLKELNLEGKIICVYAGKFGGIYLGNEVFDLILEAEKFWGDRFRFLLLTSHPKEEIELFRQNSGIGLHTIIRKFVKHSEVPNYMGLGDFALTPVKSVPSKRFCTPIKDGEYWALGLPIVITKEISDDSEIIERNAIGYVLKELTNQEYFNAVQKIDTFLKGKSRMEIYNKIRPFAEKYRNLQIADGVYQEIYGN